MHADSQSLVVTVKTGRELDAALDEALERLMPVAITEKVGISVTRLAPGIYEARPDNNVPLGMIRERWGSGAHPEGTEGNPPVMAQRILGPRIQ
jgi:hypothetical protein